MPLIATDTCRVSSMSGLDEVLPDILAIGLDPGCHREQQYETLSAVGEDEWLVT